jgi:hypothetical protein
VSSDPPSLTRADLEARARRFATLRAAQRALVPSVRSPEALPPQEPIRAIRDQIRALLACVGDATGSDALADVGRSPELDAIDDALDGYAYQLAFVADHVPVAQFRASLPELAGEQRQEVIALLDVLLEDEGATEARLSLLDYVVTLLCTARQDGQWTLVADPSTVSEGTRTRAFTQPLGDPELEAEIVGRFRSATERLNEGEDFENVVREMQAYKKSIIPHFFAPEVLRCVVAYNLALRHIRDRALAQARALDREVDVQIRPEPETPEVEPGGRPHSAFGAPGLRAIESALERRVAESDPLPGAAGAIAARLDVGKLHAAELRLFAQPARDSLGRLQRRIVVIGLVAEILPQLRGELAALQIDPRRLTGEWVREVAHRVENKTNDLVADKRYDDARRISDLQSRILIAPLISQGRLRAAATPARRPSPRPDPAFTPPAARPPRPDARPSRSDTARRADPREREDRRPRAARRLPPRRLRVLVALLLLLVGGVAYRSISRDPREVRTLSSRELAQISPLLVSGYRSERGQGLMFIGTLADGWQRMDRTARQKAAEGMRDRLERAGVSEVILFNGERALQVHYVGGTNTYPGWDSESKRAG